MQHSDELENGGENFGEKAHVRKNGQKLTDTQKKILACIAEDKYISAFIRIIFFHFHIIALQAKYGM